MSSKITIIIAVITIILIAGFFLPSVFDGVGDLGDSIGGDDETHFSIFSSSLNLILIACILLFVMIIIVGVIHL